MRYEEIEIIQKIFPRFMLLVVVMFACCSVDRDLQAPGSGPGQGAELSQTSQWICDDEGFNPGSHTLNPIDKPFVVRKVHGRFFWSYGWPGGHGPLFELRRIGKGTRIRRVYADDEGYFAMKGVPEGCYCYMVTFIGFVARRGFIIVDKKADRKSTVFIKMLRD